MSEMELGDADGIMFDRIARGDVFQLGCPSRDIMRHVTSRWGVLLLIALQGGTHRFSALRRKVTGVSERMLAQTLQWFEADGLVERRAYPVVPPHVEYSLTPARFGSSRQGSRPRRLDRGEPTWAHLQADRGNVNRTRLSRRRDQSGRQDCARRFFRPRPST